jgi:hypothetical protein
MDNNIFNKSQSTFEPSVVFTFHNAVLDAMLDTIPSEFHLPLVVVVSTFEGFRFFGFLFCFTRSQCVFTNDNGAKRHNSTTASLRCIEILSAL